MRGAAVLLIAILPLIGSCEILGPEDPTPVEFATVRPCRELGVGTVDAALIDDEADWRAYWLNRRGERADTVALPAVDFSKRSVIILFWEPRSGCNGCVEAVERVEEKNGVVIVTVGDLPDPGPCRAFVQPHQVIAIPKTDGGLLLRGNFPG